jgi:hypothetical protein
MNDEEIEALARRYAESLVSVQLPDDEWIEEAVRHFIRFRQETATVEGKDQVTPPN